MIFTDFLNRPWAIAVLDPVQFPTSTGGNSRDCPLDDVTRAFYNASGTDPDQQPVIDAVAPLLQERGCWHHRWRPEDLCYIAELSCWFVEQQITPLDDIVSAVVRRDEGRLEHLHAVMHLFDDPLNWGFEPFTQLNNGRHRLCAMKWAGVKRVAVRPIS